MKVTSSSLVQEIRRAARLTQAELARRAGTGQSAISAYESGGREPTLATLLRLADAAGVELDVGLRPRGTRSDPGALRRRLREQRERVHEIAAAHGARDVRVFGSVARGEHTPASDIDLLVDMEPGRTLGDLAELAEDLEALLGAPVDVVTTGAARGDMAGIVQEAVPV